MLVVSAAVSVLAAGREELAHRELDLAEHLAGVLLAGIIAAGAAAILGGDAVVIGGDEKLGIPLYADDGELAQGDKEPVLVAAHHQLIAEAGGHAHGNVRAGAVAGAAVAHIHQLQVEDQRIHRLHHRRRHAGAGQALDLGPVLPPLLQFFRATS